MAAQADSQFGTVVVRKSDERGHADHGWLNSYHTFSFANYNDYRYDSFHSLRVINEDRVAAGQGFPTHGHANFEIFSYIVSGELTHKDSMGNVETVKRGQIQFTSGGTGIRHSEYNDHPKETVHFIQIWVVPQTKGLKPNYQTKAFPEEEKRGKLRLLISPDGDQNTVVINQDFKMYASLLKNGEEVTLNVEPNRSVFVHLIQLKGTGIKVNNTPLVAGDGAFVKPPANDAKSGFKLTIQASNENDDAVAEFLVFDIAHTDGSD